VIEDAADATRDAREKVGDSTWIGRLGRIGLLAKGISYGLVGALALALAVRQGGKATSREGALETLADEWWGKVVLALLAAGFASYAIWRLAQAIFDRDDEGTDAAGVAKRAGYLGRALLYGALTAVTITLLDGTENEGSGSGSDLVDEDETTALVLGLPAGRWLVGVAGLVLLGAACFNAYRAFTQSFEHKWTTGKMGQAERAWGARLSSVGLLARFVIFGLIGSFLLKAAYEYDPQEAIGLDGALRKVAQADYGPVLLSVVAAGLLCYALFCVVESRYRRV